MRLSSYKEVEYLDLDDLEPDELHEDDYSMEEDTESSDPTAFKTKGGYQDSIKSYLKEVSRYKLLNFEEEKELSRQIQKGDPDALNQLIQSNLRLVIKIAKAFVSKEYPLVDIIQDGNIGLIRAAQKYDHKKNVRFSTYGAQWIKQMIIRALSQKRRLVRLPYRKEKTLKKIKETANKFFNDHKRYPTTQELSNFLDIPPHEIETTKFSEVSISSLEASLCDENAFTLENIVESSSFNPHESLVQRDMVEDTQMALNSLIPKERTILIHRFGLKSEDKHTLKEMGEHFGISAETVRQIENRSLKKLEETHYHLKSYIHR